MQGVYGSFDAMWRDVVSALTWQREYSRVESRVGPCREILGFSARVMRPRTVPTIRGFDPAYAAAELLWYLSGTDDGTMIRHYAPSYGRFLVPDDAGVPRAYGAYGARWSPQLDQILQKLRGDPDTRQAVLATWRSGDATAVTPDVPCTLSLQFLLRDGALHLVATMRSNDVWLGMPYDVFAFSRLQYVFADLLDVRVGTYTHQVGSLHLYEKDAERALACLDLDDSETQPLYEPLSCGYETVADAAWKACAAERNVRLQSGGLHVAETQILGTGLVGTELGAMVMLCASRGESELPLRLAGVDHTLWTMLLKRRAKK